MAQVLVCTHKAFPRVEREDTRIEEEDEAVVRFSFHTIHTSQRGQEVKILINCFPTERHPCHLKSIHIFPKHQDPLLA